MKTTNGVVGLHIGVLFGAWNLQPYRRGQLGIEGAGNVPLQTVSDHDRTVSRNSKFTEENMENLGSGLPDSMLA
jgi:hypothetical protein